MSLIRRILIMIAVSVLCVLLTQFMQSNPISDTSSNIISESELLERVYRYSSFTRVSDDSYVVEELIIDPIVCSTIEELSEIFMSAPYSEVNSEDVFSGVNCQGMTVAIADWCDRMEMSYQVFFSVNHVYIVVADTDCSYTFSFGEKPIIKKERNT